MNNAAHSIERGPLDHFHFGVAFLGFILAAAGIVVTSPGFTVFGGLVFAAGLAWFLVRR
jgi:cytochrome b subunit of formate dehydrogenase